MLETFYAALISVHSSMDTLVAQQLSQTCGPSNGNSLARGSLLDFSDEDTLYVGATFTPDSSDQIDAILNKIDAELINMQSKQVGKLVVIFSTVELTNSFQNYLDISQVDVMATGSRKTGDDIWNCWSRNLDIDEEKEEVLLERTERRMLW